MIKRSNKILLLLAAFYYVVQAESTSIDCHVYYLSFNPSDPIPVTQVFEPDFSLYDSHLFTHYFRADTHSDNSFASQWRLSILHFNQYIAQEFVQFTKSAIDYQRQPQMIHITKIIFTNNSDDIPLFFLYST